MDIALAESRSRSAFHSGDVPPGRDRIGELAGRYPDRRDLLRLGHRRKLPEVLVHLVRHARRISNRSSIELG
jgi:hypothetical protein